MSKLNFLERLQAALANHEILPELGDTEEVAESETEFGKLPPALQGLWALGEEIAKEHNARVANLSQNGNETKSVDDLRREVRELREFYEKVRELFWALGHNYFGVETTKFGGTAIRKNWTLVGTTKKKPSFEDMMDMPGAPDGIMVAVVGGTGRSRRGGLDELLDRLRRG